MPLFLVPLVLAREGVFARLTEAPSLQANHGTTALNEDKRYD